MTCFIDREIKKIYKTLIEPIDDFKDDRVILEVKHLDIDDSTYERELAFLEEIEKLERYK